MKTKYIKVAVSERLPEKEGKYFVWIDDPNAEMYEYEEDQKAHNMNSINFKEGEFKSFYDVTHFIEEVPDREQEMKEMLEKIREDQYSIGEIDKQTFANLEELLNSIK